MLQITLGSHAKLPSVNGETKVNGDSKTPVTLANSSAPVNKSMPLLQRLNKSIMLTSVYAERNRLWASCEPSSPFSKS